LRIQYLKYIALVLCIGFSVSCSDSSKFGSSKSANNFSEVSSELQSESLLDQTGTFEDPGMTTLFENGLSLVGAQYWVFVGSVPFHFPEDVLWGFYPEEISDNALSCAEQSFNLLRNYIQSDWILMQAALSLGATNQIYILTTDYSYSADDRTERSSQIWHSAGTSGDYSLGYWVWETAKALDGTCQLPTRSEVAAFLEAAIHKIESDN